MEKLPQNNEYGKKSQLLREDIDELGVEYLQYVSKSHHFAGALQLALEGPARQRILIQRINPTRTEAVRVGAFFQDTCVTIFPGQMENPDFERIDYNYSQYHKDELRYREIIGDARLPRDVVFGENAASINNVGTESLRHWYNDRRTLGVQAFEEQMGLNNYPALDEQVDELRDILRHSVVLDPNNDYQPVIET